MNSKLRRERVAERKARKEKRIPLPPVNRDLEHAIQKDAFEASHQSVVELIDSSIERGVDIYNNAVVVLNPDCCGIPPQARRLVRKPIVRLETKAKLREIIRGMFDDLLPQLDDLGAGVIPVVVFAGQSAALRGFSRIAVNSRPLGALS